MSSGNTHDNITLFITPVLFGAGYFYFGMYSLYIAISFLFSGMMFNGDLDINSQVYKRWLLLKWIWLPYRKFGHRSIWTHGPIIGTLVRLTWILMPLLSIIYFFGWIDKIQPFILAHHFEIVLVLIGLELGNLSHSIMDLFSTKINRIF
jgi:uncharacterized metal-binding protein